MERNGSKVFKLVILFVFLNLSCSTIVTNKSQYSDIDYNLHIGNTSKALQGLLDSRDLFYSEKDRVLYYLEEGMLYHFNHDYEESNKSLTKAEYFIEELMTKSISKGILSGVLNDNALPYNGEDYEDIYINIFKSLNYIHLKEYESALVEIRRFDLKLKNLEHKYSLEINNFNKSEDITVPEAEYNYHNDALARYLGSILYRYVGAIDDKRIEDDYFMKAFINQPLLYDFNAPDKPVSHNDKAIVNLFTFTGLIPEKEAETYYVNNSGNIIYFDSYSQNIGFNKIVYKGMKGRTNLKLEFPTLVKRSNPVEYIEIVVNNISYGYLKKIESFENIALEAFKLRQPLIIGKTVIRAISKALISNISEDIVEDNFGKGLGILTNLAGTVYMFATENSDLRAARYFPGVSSVSEIELEPGNYNFSFVYYNKKNKAVFKEDFNNIEIRQDKLNLLESSYIGL